MPEAKPYKFETVEGHKFSGIDGKMQSVNDEPAVIYADGTKWWYENNRVSRGGDKPAVVWSNGVEEWWQDGYRHRDVGPAVIYPDTPNIHPQVRATEQYWRNGRFIRSMKRKS